MQIRFASVGFRYEREPILRDVNLEIPAGSLTVICGRTGSGKSTLLQLMAGLESPTAGTIRYKGAGETDDRILPAIPRERLAIVFQMPEAQLFAGTVQQDVGFGLEVRKVPKPNQLPRIEEALRRVGLESSEFLERSPFLLSGGEKRRVAIAGALVLEPELLILDEPTAGLDPAASRELLGILARLREQRMTIVVATHDLDSFFPLADQVVVMEKGQVAYAGGSKGLLMEATILQEAGLEFPSAARIASLLRKNGILVEAPLSVDELIESLERGNLAEPSQAADWELIEDTYRSEVVPISNRLAAPVLNQQPESSMLHRLDPRMKWFAMVSLSLACLSVANGWGVAASFALTAALFRFAKISWRRAWTFFRPVLFVFGFLFAISAVTFQNPDWSLGPIGITWQGAKLGGIGVARFLLVILLGFLFTETTTGAPLREGLEWAIRPLRKVGVPTRDISLAVSIALQFVPWILEKMGQIRKALASRGQEITGIRKWSPRQISMMVVPLMISVLTLGDELATAIESRGYNRYVERTPWYELRWTRTDTVACGITAVTAGLIGWLG
ncbi:ATP-binding cassette domain-containing protein [Effusibacillus consociatus]|uniref:ATP-binding cassette domain-containing protein n=1 Tax=Effusibacillus consociatus TaxID=1117041 RepID=A0ABV9Q0A1_9BACL